MKKIISTLLVAAAFSSAAMADQGLTIGSGAAKFNGLLQVWGVNDTTTHATSPADPHLQFLIHRAEMKFSGSVLENTRWFLMVDAARTINSSNSKLVQDIGLAYSLTPNFEITVGQFKIPTLGESMMNSGSLLLPERSYSARYFGNYREPGVMATYTHDMIKLYGMVSNGEGDGAADTNNKKDLNFRAEVTPNDSFAIGVFTTMGNYAYSAKRRWGADMKYEMGDLHFDASYVMANTAQTVSNPAATGSTQVRGIDQKAIQATVAYMMMNTWQPVFRWQQWHTDDNWVGLFSTAWEVGVNYYMLKNNSKIQGSFGRLNDFIGTNGTPTPAGNTEGWLSTLAFQTAI